MNFFFFFDGNFSSNSLREMVLVQKMLSTSFRKICEKNVLDNWHEWLQHLQDASNHRLVTLLQKTLKIIRLAWSKRFQSNISDEFSKYKIIPVYINNFIFFQSFQKKRQRSSLLFGGRQFIQFLCRASCSALDDLNYTRRMNCTRMIWKKRMH